MSGFAAGFLKGAIASVVVGVGVSLMAPLPPVDPADETAVEVPTPEGSGFNAARTDTNPVLPDTDQRITPEPAPAPEVVTAPASQPAPDTETAARDLLAPLPIDRLPLDTATRSQLCDLGLRTIGAIADLPRAEALERLGFRGFSAWRLARGEDDRPLRPRCPPRPLSAQYQFPDPVGALPVLHAAARLLLGELAVQARGSGRGIRAVHTRARLTDGGSWTHRLALREATTDPERLAVAVLPALADVTAPVDVLAIQVDASGVPDGRQLTLQRAGHAEQLRRTGEAIRHIRATVGDTALLRVVELEPWSHLPERKWALVPFDISPHLDPSV